MRDENLNYRQAVETDVWSLMALYQRVGSTHTVDNLFLDYEKMKKAVVADDSRWMLTERVTPTGSELVAVVSTLLDREQGVAKISRMMVNPSEKDPISNLRDALRRTIAYLDQTEPTIEMFYSTTLTLPFNLQEVTLLEGFHVMGVFPNALGVDRNNLNGLTALYKKGVLDEKRAQDFSLHPVAHPFFKIAQNSLDLPEVRVSKDAHEGIVRDYEPLPELELINAPRFVGERFQDLKDDQSSVVHFYPFYSPNCMISDSKERIQIYVKIIESVRFAAIIGEHLEMAINPVELYERVLQILRQHGISYVETINDAADVFGTQCFLDASFTPCAYIPAFKRQGESRRDYLVFGKSFEYMCRPGLNVREEYIQFFRQYFRIERRNYFGRSEKTQ